MSSRRCRILARIHVQIRFTKAHNVTKVQNTKWSRRVIFTIFEIVFVASIRYKIVADDASARHRKVYFYISFVCMCVFICIFVRVCVCVFLRVRTIIVFNTHIRTVRRQRATEDAVRSLFDVRLSSPYDLYPI